MIPKIIHYCWFGHNPLPPLAIKCIDSWRKYLPDYEIKEWNESNFDVNTIAYTTEAYQARKFAFVSDYARFWILYHEGGLYFDTDVELIKPIDDIITEGGFIGCEADRQSNTLAIKVNPGLGLGCEKGNPIINAMLAYYTNLSFLLSDGSYNYKTIVDYTTTVLKTYGLSDSAGIQKLDGITVYPSDYFNPINSITKRCRITSNTRSIHYGAASWQQKGLCSRFKKFLRNLFPDSVLIAINRLKHK